MLCYVMKAKWWSESFVKRVLIRAREACTQLKLALPPNRHVTLLHILFLMVPYFTIMLSLFANLYIIYQNYYILRSPWHEKYVNLHIYVCVSTYQIWYCLVYNSDLMWYSYILIREITYNFEETEVDQFFCIIN